MTATCYNQQNCSAHGVCVGIDVCRCDLGWTSSSCSQPSCEIINWCSGHGRCIAHDVCLCESGWTDNSCSIPDCSNQNDCSNHGDCLHPGTCSCHPGYEGADCSGNTKCIALDNCNGHGLCLAESELKDDKKHSVIKCRYDKSKELCDYNRIYISNLNKDMPKARRLLVCMCMGMFMLVFCVHLPRTIHNTQSRF